MISVTLDRRRDVLDLVARRPGIKAVTAARELGMGLDTLRTVVRALRAAGVLAPLGALVPRAGFDPSGLTPREADVYGWACDLIGSAEECSEALDMSYTRVRMVLTSLRAFGAIEHADGLWTVEHVERSQDAAWEALADARATVAA